MYNFRRLYSCVTVIPPIWATAIAGVTVTVGITVTADVTDMTPTWAWTGTSFALMTIWLLETAGCTTFPTTTPWIELPRLASTLTFGKVADLCHLLTAYRCWLFNSFTHNRLHSRLNLWAADNYLSSSGGVNWGVFNLKIIIYHRSRRLYPYARFLTWVETAGGGNAIDVFIVVILICNSIAFVSTIFTIFWK